MSDSFMENGDRPAGDLTKREHFAGLVMQGALSNPTIDLTDRTLRSLALMSVEAAEDLLLMLNKRS